MNILPARMDLPSTTLTGNGAAAGLLPHCAGFGPRGVVVHGGSVKRSGVLDDVLSAAGRDMHVVPFLFQGGEPCLHHAEELLSVIRETGADWVAAIGGGSVLDLAKAGAGLANAVRYGFLMTGLPSRRRG